MNQNEIIKRDKAKSDLIKQIIELNKKTCEQQGVNWYLLNFETSWKEGLQHKGIRDLKQELILKQQVLVGKSFVGYYPKDNQWSEVRTIVSVNDYMITDNKGTGWFIGDSIKLI